LVRAAALNSGGKSGVFFRNGYTTSNYYNCSILTHDHNADGWSDGLSINGWNGISFCTGSNTRNERTRINSSGNVRIQNTSPWVDLNLGNVDVGGSSGSLVFGKNKAVEVSGILDRE
jgi:hypothetical protein